MATCISSVAPVVFLANFFSAEITGAIILAEKNCNRVAIIKNNPGNLNGNPATA